MKINFVILNDVLYFPIKFITVLLNNEHVLTLLAYWFGANEAYEAPAIGSAVMLVREYAQ